MLHKHRPRVLANYHSLHACYVIVFNFSNASWVSGVFVAIAFIVSVNSVMSHGRAAYYHCPVEWAKNGQIIWILYENATHDQRNEYAFTL